MLGTKTFPKTTYFDNILSKKYDICIKTHFSNIFDKFGTKLTGQFPLISFNKTYSSFL